MVIVCDLPDEAAVRASGVNVSDDMECSSTTLDESESASTAKTEDPALEVAHVADEERYG